MNVIWSLEGVFRVIPPCECSTTPLSILLTGGKALLPYSCPAFCIRRFGAIVHVLNLLAKSDQGCDNYG